MRFLCYTGHGSEVSLDLMESTGSILEFFTVETMPLFDVSFRGYIAKVEDKAHIKWSLLPWFRYICSSKTKKLKASANKREEREVEGSQRTMILTRHAAMTKANWKWTKIWDNIVMGEWKSIQGQSLHCSSAITHPITYKVGPWHRFRSKREIWDSSYNYRPAN